MINQQTLFKEWASCRLTYSAHTETYMSELYEDYRKFIDAEDSIPLLSKTFATSLRRFLEEERGNSKFQLKYRKGSLVLGVGCAKALGVRCTN